jgi:flagellar biogenesis protein FliO
MRKMFRRIAAALCLALSVHSFSVVAQNAAAATPAISTDWFSLMLPLLVVIATGIVALWLVQRCYAGASGSASAARLPWGHANASF